MRKAKLRIRKVRINGEVFHQLLIPQAPKGVVRKTFKDRAEAQTALDLARVQQTNFGLAALAISDGLRLEAIEGAERLRPFGKSLTDAVDFYEAHLRRERDSMQLDKAVEAFLAEKQKERRTARYVNDLRLRLTRFAKDHQGQAVASLSGRDIKEWLLSLPVATETRNTFRRDLRVFLGWCVHEAGIADTNAAVGVKRFRPQAGEQAEANPLSVEEAEALLRACTPDLIPYVAIGLFAGLRSAELAKLDWMHVHLNAESPVITVPAGLSGKSRKRTVDIQPNLKAWLSPLAQKRGPIAPDNLRKRFDAVRRAAGFRGSHSVTPEEKALDANLKPWPSNCLRHSYGSYYMAIHRNAAACCDQMGNSPSVLHRDYRQPLPADEARRYWALLPTDPMPRNVVSMASAA